MLEIGNQAQIMTFRGRAFHLTPRVKVVADGSSARIATKANVSTTGFTAHVFDPAGNDVGGAVDWEATGV